MKRLSLVVGGEAVAVEVSPDDGGGCVIRFADGAADATVRLEPLGEGVYRVDLDGAVLRAAAVPGDGAEEWFLVVEGDACVVTAGGAPRGGAARAAGDGRTLSPVPGIVRKVLVEVGQAVEKGQPVAVVEAMKMEISIPAGRAGRVDRVLARPGETVAAGAEIVSVRPA